MTGVVKLARSAYAANDPTDRRIRRLLKQFRSGEIKNGKFLEDIFEILRSARPRSDRAYPARNALDYIYLVARRRIGSQAGYEEVNLLVCETLLRCARNFDPRRPVSFITYLITSLENNASKLNHRARDSHSQEIVMTDLPREGDEVHVNELLERLHYESQVWSDEPPSHVAGASGFWW